MLFEAFNTKEKPLTYCGISFGFVCSSLTTGSLWTTLASVSSILTTFSGALTACQHAVFTGLDVLD